MAEANAKSAEANDANANKDLGTKELEKEINEFVQGAVQTTKSAKTTKRKGISRRRSPKKEKKAVMAGGKRKEAVARATLRSGIGRLRLNGVDVSIIKPAEIREIILEPLHISEAAAKIARASDIDISVYGGGISGQAQASRNALAKVILKASESEEIRMTYRNYDRRILADDSRRVEPKKFEGPKARARFQTSYR